MLVESRCFAIADGVGQRPGGEAAAQVAIDTLWAFTTYATELDLVSVLRTADRSIRAMAASDRMLQCASATMTVVRIESTESGLFANVANVGGSRLYVFRGGQIKQFIDSGTGESRGPDRSPGALGMGPAIDVTTQRVALEPNDRLLLCTDGITTKLSTVDLLRIASQSPEPDDVASRLVWSALSAGSRSDVTAIVIDVERSTAKPSGIRRLTSNRVGQLVAA